MLEQAGSSWLIPRVLTKNIKGMSKCVKIRKNKNNKGSNQQREDLKAV